MSVVIPLCTSCGHFNYKNIEKNKTHYWCKAFPEGIPREVMFNPTSTKEDECNNGVHYEPEE